MVGIQEQSATAGISALRETGPQDAASSRLRAIRRVVFRDAREPYAGPRLQVNEATTTRCLTTMTATTAMTACRDCLLRPA
ncbi:hypothetical protein O9K51_06129 [Purpureocillium lavendulum]|uniref:Uncharacterized protein n=1 Tax=Purpureocillium lavendulum TaxID=1247861 RepID=A0AB34FMM8_9HYPO|nr:hypothetical protein O9K51_06129 [Purpureocillium lavendulum]